MHVRVAEAEAETQAERPQRQRKPAFSRAPPGVCLLDKHEIRDITGLSFQTIWAWMRANKFPRSRIVGGKSMWLSTEIDSWLAGLPVRPLKGDAPPGQKIEETETA